MKIYHIHVIYICILKMYNFICYELIKKEQVEDMLKSQKSLKCTQTNAANTATSLSAAQIQTQNETEEPWQSRLSYSGL